MERLWCTLNGLMAVALECPRLLDVGLNNRGKHWTYRGGTWWDGLWMFATVLYSIFITSVCVLNSVGWAGREGKGVPWGVFHS